MIAFRVDADSAIGLGHLSRIATLAGAFKEPCVFITTTPEALQGHETRAIAAPRGTRADALATSAAARDASLLVLDDYTFDAPYAAALAPSKLLWIDDGGFKDARRGFVLNHNLYATEALYPAKAASDLMLGPSYALLRDEFVAAREHPKAPHERRRILVTMGGSDPPNMTARVLETLQGAEAEVRVLAGRLNSHIDSLSRFGWAELVVGAADVARHMGWADVAVSAAGGTAMELACVGVPTVVIAIADNQRPVAAALSERGLAISVGDAAACRKAIDDVFADGERMRARQLALVDGQGKHRVVERVGRPS